MGKGPGNIAIYLGARTHSQASELQLDDSQNIRKLYVLKQSRKLTQLYLPFSYMCKDHMLLIKNIYFNIFINFGRILPWFILG